MHQKHDMTTPKMTRVTVRVPKTTLDQINEWVDTLGVRRSHFLGIAIVAGARALISASALEVQPGPLSLALLGAPSEGQVQAPPDRTEVLPGAVSEIDRLQAEIVALKQQLHEGRGGMKRASQVAEAVPGGAARAK